MEPLLAAVQELLGTPTLKATIAGALDEVIALDRRRRTLLAERGVEATDLADPLSVTRLMARLGHSSSRAR